MGDVDSALTSAKYSSGLALVQLSFEIAAYKLSIIEDNFSASCAHHQT